MTASYIKKNIVEQFMVLSDLNIDILSVLKYFFKVYHLILLYITNFYVNQVNGAKII